MSEDQAEIFIVMYCEMDRNGQCDSKPRILGIYDTHDIARKHVEMDMIQYKKSHSDFIFNREKMGCHSEDYKDWCEWAIETRKLSFCHALTSINVV